VNAFLVFALVRFFNHQAPGLWIFVDALGQYEPQMQAEQRDDHAWHYEHMQSKEAGERFARYSRTRQHQMN
jgi:hypothetical protein